MTVFIHEPDGAGEPTIWVLENGDTDGYRYTPLFCRLDLTPDERRWWPDVVARMTGTTITNDDATVDLIARTMYENDEDMTGRKSLPWDSANMAAFEGDWVREQYRTPARAVLAALTGVPHDDRITIEMVDGKSKYGRPKRQYHATCSCGWADAWWPVIKRYAVDNGEAHTREAHSDTHDGVRVDKAIKPRSRQ